MTQPDSVLGPEVRGLQSGNTNNKKGSEIMKIPENYADWIEKANKFALSLIKPDIAFLFEISEDGKRGEWATVDHANKIVYFHSRVTANPDRQGAFSPEHYMRDRHATHTRLYGGIIDALLVYQRTGIACLPDWNTNEIDSWGYDDEGKRNRIPRVSEVVSNEQREAVTV